jgi:hypothetical protein
MLPLIVILIVSWSVLWIALDHFAQQLGIVMPTFLSVIAFSYAMAFTLLRVPYLTFINAFFLRVCLFVFFSVLETIAIYQIGSLRDTKRAVTLHSQSRWIFPSAYLATVAAIVVAFLRMSFTAMRRRDGHDETDRVMHISNISSAKS